MHTAYYTRERALLGKADAGDPTVTTRALFVGPSMSSHINTVVARYAMGYGRVQNRSGVTAAAGFAARFARAFWVAGQVTATGAFTDDTTAAQDTTANDFALTAGADAGFLVAAREPFTLLAIDVGTAEAGTPTWVVEYSQAGGTWGTLTNLLSAPSFAAGEQLIWWVMPPDWGGLEAGHGAGVPVGLYGIRIRSTIAPTTLPIADSLSVFEAVHAREGLQDNTVYEFNLSRSEHKFRAPADSFYAVVNDSTTVGSIATVEVRLY